MTILGKHTIAETRDAMRATEFRVNKLIKQFSQIITNRTVQGLPPTPSITLLQSDMSKFVARWTNVRDNVTARLTTIQLLNPLVSASLLPAEDQFVAIINASIVDEPRLIDLQNRAGQEAAIVNVAPIDLSEIPKQNSPDADFAALTKLDAAIKTGEGAAAQVKKVIPWYYYAGGAAAVGAIGYVYISPFLPRRP